MHAVQILKEVANASDEVYDTQLEYGLCLFHEAAKYFKKAADNKSVVDMYNYRNMLYTGLVGVKNKENEKLGIDYIKKAAQNSNSDAIEF
ncbi:3002_t:CDS:2, partial [Dentiscutata erythropus]